MRLARHDLACGIIIITNKVFLSGCKLMKNRIDCCQHDTTSKTIIHLKPVEFKYWQMTATSLPDKKVIFYHMSVHSTHYKNVPIQIYRKFHLQTENFQIKKTQIFSYFCSKK